MFSTKHPGSTFGNQPYHPVVETKQKRLPVHTESKRAHPSVKPVRFTYGKSIQQQKVRTILAVKRSDIMLPLQHWWMVNGLRTGRVAPGGSGRGRVTLADTLDFDYLLTRPDL